MRYLAVLLAVAGCSGTSSGDASPPAPPAPTVGSGYGQCALRKGTFLLEYVTRDGNCGAIPEQVAQIDQTAAPVVAGADAGPSACSGKTTETGDNCEVTYSTRCRTDAVEKGGAASITGGSKWNVGGTYGTAIEEWSVFGAAGNAICTGTYGVTIRRQ